eukprot:CAMPEP_0175938870 /NCGR_PEP_ID=MMETSP0108-20121206/22938_1 /TAXON_ID=195067 ORGANISM="Goniomonas pacifica, Strain CCMP1869" /NCGR_SAMPLE_ID=MMETSP0108 /ASSEMBLY_ACC=CAM_ASM_000204 /LENGTH=35 /DNA_ID= /DNA_START= /DNA_END= /DNA_ORIENTATION=
MCVIAHQIFLLAYGDCASGEAQAPTRDRRRAAMTL